ncbi:GntR family transcriptional regulator [Flagellimonas zhangzhouensis]|uniref:DNA-binding transcriptional regulator, GntR family n=1 Tax=Flagellimonas zhangzhouensis TaxID=1073328 RepID=A0A1H2SJ34_9FLAO|nr:GntR family transcriptional regulator [Allomuricauda zhangzhouensis]SDQ75569.1 transcriptional regulator, GntR family [Allomuricauda zhangzhouensis]SDW31713.1 DNA-binding transcriptional regulator, GntR family [Allomuricauda zhangzhouensis]
MANTSVLRDRIKQHLLAQIQRGELKVGKTINLAALSRGTGISVTPIREALSQLEHARIIKAIPNRGFVVARLTVEEAKNIIETIAQLEVMALEASNFKLEEIAHLKESQSQMINATSISEGLDKRFKFHNQLIQNCSNKVLLQILQDLKLRFHFYEYVFIKEDSFFQKMGVQTHAIIEAIAEDNIPTAALILKMHWMSVMEHMENQMNVKNG